MKTDRSGPSWLKSSRSGGSENCVEIAFLPGLAVGVRDSKDPAGPALVFTAAEWSSFTGAITRGVFRD